MEGQPHLPPLKLFYSYAHEDEAFRAQLEKHLALLRHNGIIDEWHDRMIDPGEAWRGEINEYLDGADIILLQISADFIASEYCYGVEMKRALERHAAGEARVIPIILRPVDWTDAPFKELQFLPQSGLPITQWPDPDAAYADVAQGIRRVCEELQRNQAGARPGVAAAVPSGTAPSAGTAYGAPPAPRPWLRLMAVGLPVVAVLIGLGLAVRYWPPATPPLPMVDTDSIEVAGLRPSDPLDPSPAEPARPVSEDTTAAAPPPADKIPPGAPADTLAAPAEPPVLDASRPPYTLEAFVTQSLDPADVPNSPRFRAVALDPPQPIRLWGVVEIESQPGATPPREYLLEWRYFPNGHSERPTVLDNYRTNPDSYRFVLHGDTTYYPYWAFKTIWSDNYGPYELLVKGRDAEGQVVLTDTVSFELYRTPPIASR